MATEWWGKTTLQPGQTRFWQVGPRHLWITREATEWRITTREGDDPFETTLQVACDQPGEPETDAEVARYGFRTTRPELRITAALADRPVVIKTATPFYVPAGEEVRVFVSTMAWIRITVGDPEVELLDDPIRRPSDSWFGPSTREGELCYASRTVGRLSLENLPSRPQRVVTSALVRNSARTFLPLERLKLPMTNLSLYAHEGRLYTEDIVLERSSEDENAVVRLNEGAPAVAPGAARITPPRSGLEKSVLTRAFGTLLGRKGVRARERVVE